MTIETRIPKLSGLEWGVMVTAMPEDPAMRGVPVQLTLTDARAAAADAGWRLPSLRDVAVAFDGGEKHQFSGEIYQLPQRFWLRHDKTGNSAAPTGYQLNVMGGAVWPHPASELLSVVVVRVVP